MWCHIRQMHPPNIFMTRSLSDGQTFRSLLRILLDQGGDRQQLRSYARDPDGLCTSPHRRPDDPVGSRWGSSDLHTALRISSFISMCLDNTSFEILDAYYVPPSALASLKHSGLCSSCRWQGNCSGSRSR